MVYFDRSNSYIYINRKSESLHILWIFRWIDFHCCFADVRLTNDSTSSFVRASLLLMCFIDNNIQWIAVTTSASIIIKKRHFFCFFFVIACHIVGLTGIVDWNKTGSWLTKKKPTKRYNWKASFRRRIPWLYSFIANAFSLTVTVWLNCSVINTHTH